MSTGQVLGSCGQVEILPGVLTVNLSHEGTFPPHLPCVPSELLTDSLEMRTTASLIVTMFSGT
jgi:hypothetical protein